MFYQFSLIGRELHAKKPSSPVDTQPLNVFKLSDVRLPAHKHTREGKCASVPPAVAETLIRQ